MLNGIAQLNFGVDDLAKATRFIDDFGLPLVEKQEAHSLYRLAEGSFVSLRHIDDPAVPKSDLVGAGVQEVIWGCDTKDSFNRYADRLARTLSITEVASGTIHFVAPFGQAMGLRFQPRIPVVSSPSPVNTPGQTNRFNQWRKWRRRAEPKQIMHSVFRYPDVNAALDFFRGTLDFRISEVQKGIGVYLRCSGTSQHHVIALLDATVPFIGNGTMQYDHTNFIVEDIDELMIGKAYMERQGWEKSPQGIGRHRIGSALYVYMPSPLGGDIEYGADADQIDDTWVPHVWSGDFGFRTWMHNPPPFMMHEPEWDLAELPDPHTARHQSMAELISSGAIKAPAPADHNMDMKAGSESHAEAAE